MQGKIAVNVHYYEQGNVSYTTIFICSYLSPNESTSGPTDNESRGVSVVTTYYRSVVAHPVRS
jgi:hypothetical protein